jgi:hypothetical protein
MTVRIHRRFPTFSARDLDTLLRTLGEFSRTLYEDLQNLADAVNAAPSAVSAYSSVTTVTSSTLLTTSERTVLVDDDAAGGAVTINLPTLTGNLGLPYTIKKMGSTANVTVDGFASEAIDGATTYVLTSQYETVSIVAGPSSWCVQ